MKQFELPNGKQPLPEKKLKRKQRMQIRIRRVTDQKPYWMGPLMACVLCFLLMLVTSMLPHATVTADSQDYENIGLQLTFTGDTAISRYIQDIADSEGYEVLFEDVKAVWANSDFVFTNLEYALLVRNASEYTAEDKAVTFAGTLDGIYALLDAGFNVFSYANNHTSDYGTKAYRDAISWMYENGLSFSGYYLAAERLPSFQDDETLYAMYLASQEQQYTTLECDDGTTIGFLAVVDPATSVTGLTNYLLKSTNSQLYAFVNDAAMNTDLVVVYVHCGTEYALTYESAQEDLAHELIDAGADIVIMSHSYDLQPIELYGNGVIFYSLGNFIMDQAQTYSCDSVIVQYNCDEEGGYFELIPVRINDGIPQLTASSYYINRINKTLTSCLSDEDYYYDSASGHIIIPWSMKETGGGNNSV